MRGGAQTRSRGLGHMTRVTRYACLHILRFKLHTAHIANSDTARDAPSVTQRQSFLYLVTRFVPAPNPTRRQAREKMLPSTKPISQPSISGGSASSPASHDTSFVSPPEPGVHTQRRQHRNTDPKGFSHWVKRGRFGV